MSDIYLIDGKPHRECDCDQMGPEVCSRGVKRSMQTCGYGRCLLPVPGEAPAVGYVVDWVSAIYNVALDPQQRYRVRKFLRDQEERRDTSKENK